MKLLSTLCLFISLTNCRSTVNNDKPIEIYRMSKVYFSHADHFVIYNHEGKSDTCLINSIVDFNKQTMSIDSLLHHNFYFRRFYKKDCDLTKDFNDEGDPDAIRDYADRYYVDIKWAKYQNENSETLVDVDYYIDKKKFPIKTFVFKSGEYVDSLLLNPIPRR